MTYQNQNAIDYLRRETLKRSHEGLVVVETDLVLKLIEYAELSLQGRTLAKLEIKNKARADT